MKTGLIRNVEVTFIDKTDPTDPTRKEGYLKDQITNLSSTATEY